MPSNLRNKVIRLAHEKPELRSHLLPLLKKAAPEGFPFMGRGYEKIAKSAKTNTESLLRAKEISIKGLGIYVVVGADKMIGDLLLREMGGRKEYTLSIMVSGSLMGNGAELKGRGSTRMRTKFIQGKDITVIS